MTIVIREVLLIVRLYGDMWVKLQQYLIENNQTMSINHCESGMRLCASSSQDASLSLQLSLEPAVDDSTCPTAQQLHLTTSVSTQNQPNSFPNPAITYVSHTQTISLNTFLQELRSSHFSQRRKGKLGMKLKIVRRRRGCTICQQWVKEKSVVHSLHCRHVFHRECLQEWTKQHDSCPLCRQIIK